MWDTLKSTQTPDLLKIFRYEKAIPQYEKSSGKRFSAIKRIQKDYPKIDAFVLDDAYQHRSIKIGFNILLCDYNNPIYRDWIIPVGLLRESRKGIKRADCIIVTKCPNDLTKEKAIEIEKYLHEKNITDYEIVEKEQGSIPMTCYKFWNHNSKNIINIGSVGGWTKASTGYTFANTTKKSKALVRFLQSETDFRKFYKKDKITHSTNNETYF